MPVNAKPMSRSKPPRILLAEDDPVSLAFLAEALRGMGFDVSPVANGEAALDAAREQQFDALLLDHRLPGLDGDAAISRLRADASAVSRAAVAVATTAEPDPAVHARLRGAGFAGVLIKPLDVARLHEALRELGIDGSEESRGFTAALDDEAGLRACGNADALAALRGLFARELDALADEWNGLRADAFALASRLHRLRAACGFCGARALQSAAENLSAALREAEPVRVEESRAEFQLALAATREALECAQPSAAGACLQAMP